MASCKCVYVKEKKDYDTKKISFYNFAFIFCLFCWWVFFYALLNCSFGELLLMFVNSNYCLGNLSTCVPINIC